MRIAQVAPLYETVPPMLYGGTERITSYLTEELIRQNHEVTLFASGDSNTKAKLISPCKHSIRLSGNFRDPLIFHTMMFDQVLKMQDQFDILHFHTDYLHLLLLRQLRIPFLTTLHGRLDLPELRPLYRQFPEFPVVSISNSQKKPLPKINWAGTVYHGLPQNLLSFKSEKEKYLAFLGRISPEKNIEGAVQIARETGFQLKVAAKIDPSDKGYFDSHVKHLFQYPQVDFIGEIRESEKSDFLGKAMALLFPIHWPEPFGLVMIESLACGTPVIAYNFGSVPEIIDHGHTGFIVQDIEGAKEAVKNIHRIEPFNCRRVFEERFLVEHMAENYLSIYRELIKMKEN